MQKGAIVWREGWRNLSGFLSMRCFCFDSKTFVTPCIVFEKDSRYVLVCDFPFGSVEHARLPRPRVVEVIAGAYFLPFFGTVFLEVAAPLNVDEAVDLVDRVAICLPRIPNTYPNLQGTMQLKFLQTTDQAGATGHVRREPGGAKRRAGEGRSSQHCTQRAIYPRGPNKCHVQTCSRIDKMN